MILENGGQGGYKAEVNKDGMLLTKAVVEPFATHVSHDEEECYSILTEDAGPIANEYPIYLKNNSDRMFVIDKITTSSASADVVWKLHQVTGTAAGGAGALTPINWHLSSGKPGDLTTRGGATGVSGLSSVEVIDEWMNGVVYNTVVKEYCGKLILGKNNAIALEYDAGTGGLVVVSIEGHYED